MSKLTLFSWGYWGWGNATAQLVQLADSIEAARGFNPPVFVDIRISRSVRAKGFHGNAFGDLLGQSRYHHLSSLGNLSVLERGESGIKIKDPAKVHTLLELARRLAATRTRVIFFCSCEYPRLEGDLNACHRVTVVRLIMEANRTATPIEIVEWPGGEPQVLETEVSPTIAQKVLRGARSIPLGREVPPIDVASLAWGSLIHLRSKDLKFPVVVGPPKYGPRGWHLPVPWETADREATPAALVTKAREWRHTFGLDPKSA